MRAASHTTLTRLAERGLQEDHVSMGWGAGRKLVQVLDNTARVIAIELMCAVEGVGHRAPLRPGAGTAAVVAAVREILPPLEVDRPVASDIEGVAAWLESGTLERVVAPWAQGPGGSS